MRKFIALAVVLAGCSPIGPDSSEHEIEVLSVAASPDKSSSAVAYADMGGGAAGWCYVCVDVVPGEFKPANARCGHKQQWFRCSTDVTLKWQGLKRVVATYSGEPVTSAPVAAQSAATSPAVSIVYAVAR
ncbi:hypothetical protein [Cognatilysobacter lacus]|uniref:Uncharacterized protein n=1 Tax=Cognatilysobacter lacus TaxID=1643323 RepID=A0A5D8YXK5_9GAMM|nr:hypothetical protein [Lysobacter lacus]TZF86966.1 hypothetical protein FW784_11765 [Lysobacter lacus]